MKKKKETALNTIISLALYSSGGYLAYTDNTDYNGYIFVFYALIIALACFVSAFLIVVSVESNGVDDDIAERCAEMVKPKSTASMITSTVVTTITTLLLIALGFEQLPIFYVASVVIYEASKCICRGRLQSSK